MFTKRFLSLIVLIIILAISCTACTTTKEQGGNTQTKAEATQADKTIIDSGSETDATEKDTNHTETALPQESGGETDDNDMTSDTDQSNEADADTQLYTYTTRYGEVNAVSCPDFQFSYPDNWSVTSEEINEGEIDERVVLSNDRGVTITYMAFSWLSGAGRIMFKYEVTKAADSQFIPSIPVGTDSDYSNLGNFIVAKIKTVGELSMDADSDYTNVDGATYYAVVPESYIGIHEAVGMSGLYNEFSFEYAGQYILIAEPLVGGAFTTTEENEIIAILSSFQSVY